MLVLIVQTQTHRAFTHFGGKLVRCLAHDAQSYSGVGASGKPGAVQSRKAAWRIQRLNDRIRAGGGGDPDSGSALPIVWAEVLDWCDDQLAGRLVSATGARRGVRKPDFTDVKTAARGLHWLATEARDRFIGGGGWLSNITIFEGYENAPCGADAYDFDWNGLKFSADWHIKSGGNTRDPARCLRIYFCFDAQTQQIVVSDMPAHLRTAST